MIGKLMSEAASSIIGMFSARPVDMESNPSNFDFGSLLRSSDEQPHFGSGDTEIDAADIENVGAGEIDAVPAHHWETTNFLPFGNQSLGSTTFDKDRLSGEIEQLKAITNPVDSDLPVGKSSVPFNREVVAISRALRSPDPMQTGRSAGSVADREAHQPAASYLSDILLPQAKVTLDDGSKGGINATVGATDSVDDRTVSDGLQKLNNSQYQIGGETGKSAEQTAISRTLASGDPIQAGRSLGSVADREVHQPAAKYPSEILLPQGNAALDNDSKIGTNAPFAATDPFDGPTALDGLQKLISAQNQMRGEAGKSAEPTAKTTNSKDVDHANVHFSDLTTKLEAGKLTPAISPLVTRGAEPKDVWSNLGQLGFRASSQDPSPTAQTSPSKSIIADGEFLEQVNVDFRPATKSFETVIEQQPLVNSVAQPAVREANQKPGSFDMSSPQIAQRLAAEIADISVSGGTKTFEINPRNLGRMEINFNTRGSTEIIEIHTDHRAAKDIIVQHSQLLQDLLKSQGRDDLTFRVDVKENIFSSSRNDGGNLSQQENRDAPDRQARLSQHRRMGSSFEGAAEHSPASDNSRYA